MKYTWTAQDDENCWNDKATRVFDTQEECYADMMDHAVDKMKWNVDWDDVIDGQDIIENGGLKKTNEVGKYAGYIGYDVKFMPHKIVHHSYSGTYTYEIVTVADEGDKPMEKREERSEQDKISATKKDAESTRNKYTFGDEVEYNGIIYTIEDFHYDVDADGWVYDLRELEGDGEMLVIPQDEIKLYNDEIKLYNKDIPESIVVEYTISGNPRIYVYNLKDSNDCEHYFDDEDKIVRTFVKTDKGMGEEDYYREIPIPVVTKFVLAARNRI